MKKITIKDEVTEMENLLREIVQDQYFSCQSCESFGFLDNHIRISSNKDEFVNDPRQLKLFSLTAIEILEKEKIKQVSNGGCVSCGNLHVECPNCRRKMIDLQGAGEYCCSYCADSFEIKKSLIYKDSVLVNTKLFKKN